MIFRRALSIAGTAIVLLTALLVLLWLFQRRLIYIPIGEAPPVASIFREGVVARDVTLQTRDGLELGAWYLAPAAEDGGGGAVRATVIVFNGNAGCRADRSLLAAQLLRRGFAVLLMDYRGYGGNPGRPSETGLLEDARAARAWLAARPQVDPNRIVYFGESLGGAVAVGLAAEHEPAALILRSPFSSMTELARLHYPLLPVQALLRDRWPSVERMAAIRAPLLVIAGDRDEIVPSRLSRKLYEAATMPKRRWLEIPGAGHNDAELVAGDRVVDASATWILETAADP